MVARIYKKCIEETIFTLNTIGSTNRLLLFIIVVFHKLIIEVSRVGHEGIIGKMLSFVHKIKEQTTFTKAT